MTAIDTSRSIAASHNGTIATFLSAIMGSIATWNDARITRKALSNLTARELRDIGLTHADLGTIGTITR